MYNASLPGMQETTTPLGSAMASSIASASGMSLPSNPTLPPMTCAVSPAPRLRSIAVESTRATGVASRGTKIKEVTQAVEDFCSSLRLAEELQVAGALLRHDKRRNKRLFVVHTHLNGTQRCLLTVRYSAFNLEIGKVAGDPYF